MSDDKSLPVWDEEMAGSASRFTHMAKKTGLPMFMGHQNSHYENGWISKINTDSVTLYQNSIGICRNKQKRFEDLYGRRKDSQIAKATERRAQCWSTSSAWLQLYYTDLGQWQGRSSTEQRSQSQPGQLETPDFQQRCFKMKERTHLQQGGGSRQQALCL